MEPAYAAGSGSDAETSSAMDQLSSARMTQHIIPGSTPPVNPVECIQRRGPPVVNGQCIDTEPDVEMQDGAGGLPSAGYSNQRSVDLMEKRLLELVRENDSLRSRLRVREEPTECSISGQESVIVSRPGALPVNESAPNMSNIIDSLIQLQSAFPSSYLPTSSAPLIPSAATIVTGEPSSLPPPSSLQICTTNTAGGQAPQHQWRSVSLPDQQFTQPTGYLADIRPTVMGEPRIGELSLGQLSVASYRSLGSKVISTGRSAFQPFQSMRDSTNSAQIHSPDSSTNEISLLERIPNDQSLVQQCHPTELQQWEMSHNLYDWTTMETEDGEKVEKSTSVLGSLLSAKRKSPMVPQSCTDTHSGLATGSMQNLCDPNTSSNLGNLAVNLSLGNINTLSDSNESMESPKSTHSTTSGNTSGSRNSCQSLPIGPSNSAIVQALQSRPTNRQQYMDRRRRNNEAAKRCRANRRAQFEFRSHRANELELENAHLRVEVKRLQQEVEQLKALHVARLTAL